MANKSLFATIGALVSLLLGGGPLLADEALRQRLFEEAPEAWAALSQHASRLEGVLQIREVHKSGNDTRIISEDIAYMVNGPNMKKTRVDGSADRIWSVNENYMFLLMRDPGDDSGYTIDFLESKEQPVVMSASDIQQMVSDFLDDVHAPWMLLTRPLADWLVHPGFFVEGVEAVGGDDGKALVLVRFAYEPETEPETHRLETGSSMTLDPANSWCLTSYHVKKSWGTVEASLEYDGKQAGIPFVREKRESLISDRTKAPFLERVLKFERLSNEVPPAGDFRLSAYGFPEPRFEPRVTPTHLVFYILAALFLALFIFLRVRRRRRAPALEGA